MNINDLQIPPSCEYFAEGMSGRIYFVLGEIRIALQPQSEREATILDLWRPIIAAVAFKAWWVEAQRIMNLCSCITRDCRHDKPMRDAIDNYMAWDAWGRGEYRKDGGA